MKNLGNNTEKKRTMQAYKKQESALQGALQGESDHTKALSLNMKEASAGTINHSLYSMRNIKVKHDLFQWSAPIGDKLDRGSTRLMRESIAAGAARGDEEVESFDVSVLIYKGSWTRWVAERATLELISWRD